MSLERTASSERLDELPGLQKQANEAFKGMKYNPNESTLQTESIYTVKEGQNWPLWLKVGGVVLTIGAVVGLIVAFSVSHTLQNLLGHVVTEIKSAHMGVGEALVTIALPVAMTTGMLGLAIYFFLKHRERTQNLERAYSLQELRETIRSLKPTSKQKIAVVTAIAYAGIAALAAFLILYFVHGATNLMGQKITVWQGLTMGGALALSLIAVQAIAYWVRKKLEERALENPAAFVLEDERMKPYLPKDKENNWYTSDRLKNETGITYEKMLHGKDQIAEKVYSKNANGEIYVLTVEKKGATKLEKLKPLKSNSQKGPPVPARN